MRLLITGATGFVGGYLARYFAAQGHDVVATGRRDRPADLPAECTFHRVDLATAPLPDWGTLDVCIHAAGLASDQVGWPALFAANVTGTERLLASLPRRARLVHISSSSVYVPTAAPSREIDAERADLKRLSPYGRSKRLAELVLAGAAPQLTSTVVLRPRAIYGLGDHVLLPRLLALVRRGQARVPGDLRIRLSLTHVDNLRLAVAQAMALPASATPRTFNVADAEPYELRQVFRTLVEGITGEPVRLTELPVVPLRWLARLGLSRRLTSFALAAVTQDHVLDLTRTRQELGYRPLHQFDEAAPAIIAWARTQQF